ncbi:MAG: hypothetical protein J6U69_07945 [Alistipes sp.]|nr:hypothetical protein [Alistipes sp.]
MKREFLSLLMILAMLVCSCSESTVDPGQGNDEPTEEPNNGTEEPVEPKYKAGEYYKTGLAEGIIAHVDESGEHGLLISLDESYEQWSTDYIMLIVHGGEFSRENGARNTEYIKSQENWEELYPAVAWCNSKNALGLSSWYLPAPTELALAAQNVEAINATLEQMGYDTIATGANQAYWSSEEFGVQGAYAISFATGDFADYGHDKKAYNRVRAMRKF